VFFLHGTKAALQGSERHGKLESLQHRAPHQLKRLVRVDNQVRKAFFSLRVRLVMFHLHGCVGRGMLFVMTLASVIWSGIAPRLCIMQSRSRTRPTTGTDTHGDPTF